MARMQEAMLTLVVHGEVVLQQVVQEYTFLIENAPNLYSTQKENMIKNGSAEKLVCLCMLEKLKLGTCSIGFEKGSYSLIHCKLIDFYEDRMPFDAFLDQHYRYRLLKAYKLLEESRLRIDDEGQWSFLQDLLLFSKNSPLEWRGCCKDCRCTCLACSALSGNASSIKILGTCYHQGFGVPQNFDIALRWYSLAGLLGAASALNSIGFLYQEGFAFYNSSDISKGVKNSVGVQWYKRAAECGDRTAQYNMACAYYNGWGVKVDHTEAFKWYLESAKKGDVDAQAAVGDHYFMGDGVQCDYRKSLFWHTMAAKGGNVLAQTTVGHHYYFGWAFEGNARDLEKSFKWHSLAAENGLAQAQFFVGFMYMHGEGCEKNPLKAYEMWTLSARKGNADAMKCIANLYENGFDENGLKIPKCLVISDYWKDQALKNGLKDERVEFKSTERELINLKCNYFHSIF
jgi:TPR repeat protein